MNLRNRLRNSLLKEQYSSSNPYETEYELFDEDNFACSVGQTTAQGLCQDPQAWFSTYETLFTNSELAPQGGFPNASAIYSDQCCTGDMATTGCDGFANLPQNFQDTICDSCEDSNYVNNHCECCEASPEEMLSPTGGLNFADMKTGPGMPKNGYKDKVEDLRLKGRRRSQSHGYGCDCGDGNYDKTCCTGINESKQCKAGMYWCEKSEKCKPIDKSKRKKEQTTSGAAGAYSEPLFGKPIKRKMKIEESELIKLIEKSVYIATHGGVIKEALTDADEKRIGVLARKELKDYETKLEKKIDQAIKKAFKGKDFETSTLKITKNAIIQLYKALWIRRSFWSEYIKNTPS
tara:strand:- start:34 stop:1077 length:1044 start_codon:yes stop_codon:yes gene_type:complete